MKNLYKLFSVIFISVLTIQSIALVPIGTAATQEWYGTVTNISDGDTIDVAWNSGYSPLNPHTRVRVAGVDTNEIADSQCFADAATTRLEELIPIGTPIKTVARDINSSSLGRSIRHVFYGPGFTKNVAVNMISEGLGLPISYADEPDYRYWYFLYGERAQNSRFGMWADNACGGSSYSSSDLEMFVNYDANGDDTQNINGEYIVLKNTGASTIDISDWKVRGSARLDGERFTIPSGQSIAPGSTHVLFSGSGLNTSTKTYLDSDSAWMNNEADVLYVRDSELNIRAAKFWPCEESCGPEASLVVEDIRYDAFGDDSKNPNGEWVRLRNVGNSTIDLENWTVSDNSETYRFYPGNSVAPGKRIIIYVGKGTSTSSIKYWGKSSGILSNTGNDKVTVSTPDSVEVDCFSWGSTNRCKNENIRGAVRVYANFNASGNDVNNPNGEWVSLHNTSGSTVNIGGYKIYKPGIGFYAFPSGTKISSGSNLRLRIGKGSNNTLNKYWDKSTGILRNSGDYVAFTTPGNETIQKHSWPCEVSCGYSFGLDIDKVNYNAPGDDSKNPNGEWVRIKNNSSAWQNFRNWKVKVGPYQLAAVANRTIPPGGTITIYMGKGTSTSSKMYWGKSSGILYNSGSRVVELLSPLRHEADCYSWGSGSCQ